MKRELENTLLMMHLYQQYYSFKGIVFTTSPIIIDYCNQHNLTVITTFERNQFNLPQVNSLFIEMVNRVNASFYGYMNSDILIHPNVFNLLPVIHTKIENGVLPTDVGLVSSVFESKTNYETNDFASCESLKSIFEKKKKKGHMRSIYAIVRIDSLSIILRMYSFIHHHFLSGIFLPLWLEECLLIVFCFKLLNMMMDSMSI